MKWTREIDATILAMSDAGTSYRQLAAQFGTTPGSIAGRIKRLRAMLQLAPRHPEKAHHEPRPRSGRRPAWDV